MAIFTIQEIEQQMVAFKAALLACAGGASYRMNTGTGDRWWTSADLPEIRNTLAFLQGERAKLMKTAGPVTLQGRPAR